jgi:ferric enterobactin receptor
MKKILIISIFLIISIPAISQTMEITGIIADSVTKKPLPYGNVVIKNSKDSIIKVILTNEAGEFKIRNLQYKTGIYLLAKYLGYKDKKIELAPNKNNKINTGSIFLAVVATKINETTITGTVKYMEQKFDRKVFNINDAKTAAARTIFDLLKTLPGVVVDDEGIVRYKGAEAAIYIDDQPSDYLYPKIEMIPVENITKIELIDAAMQTGGSGRGGIINIKYKIVRDDGLSGLAKTNSGTIEFQNIDKSKNFLNLNYKKKNITFLNNCYFENGKLFTNSITKKQISTFQIPTRQNINNYWNAERQLYYDFIGMFYAPSQKTEMYIGTGFFNFQFNSIVNNVFSELMNTNDFSLNNYNFNESSKNYQINKGINFALKHNIDTNDTYIRVFANFKINKYSYDQTMSYYYHIINSSSVDSIYKNRDDRDDVSKKISCSFFYNHTISKNARWNLSYSTTIGLRNNSKNDHFIFDTLYLPLSKKDSVNTQEHDLSWRIGTTLKKWKFDGGIDFSDSYIKGTYKRYEQDNNDTILNINKNYFKILPSATIAFEINDTEEVKLTFSQTSNFPVSNQLSNYIDKGLYYWSSGNSSLKPVDIYSIYLGYTYNKEKWNATVEGFFDYTDNEVKYVSYPLSSLLVLTKPENIAKQSNTGIDLSLWVQVNSKCNFSLSSSCFYTNYNATALKNTASYFNLPVTDLIKTQFGYYIKYNMEYKIKKFSTMFYINYNSKELTYDGYNKAWINSSISISRKFLKDKLALSMGINNIFDDMVEHGYYSNNFGIMNNTRTYDSKYKRLYSFSIQYNFRQGDRGTKDYKIGG